MDVSTIKHYIQTKTVPQFMIFTGPEWVVQKIYIDKIAEVVGLDKKYVDSIADIYGTLRSRNMLSKDSLYVIRDDKEITGNEKIQEQLQHNLLRNNYLILLLTTVDKRTKFYKTYKDSICEFEPLKPAVLKKYIQKEVPLTDDNCDKLMEVCEYDYGRCLLEIDKIRNYGKARMQYDPNTLLHSLLQDGTIYQPPKDAIFDFVDAILDRKTSCFKLYEQCKAVGEATMVMLTVLYNNAKAVLQVQSCSNTGDIVKTTGLTPWQVKNADKHVGRYKTSELVRMLRLIRDCEKGIKIGKYEEQYVMEYILTEVL